MPHATPSMVGGMIIFMAAGMLIAMVTTHLVRSNHSRQNGSSTHQAHGVFPVANWVIKQLLRLGIRVTILGPMMLLTVRGRMSGQPRTIPIDVHVHNGRRYLIATHGTGSWVYNLRAAGGGMLSLGWQRQLFTAQELTPEAAGAIIMGVLGPLLATDGIRGSALRKNFGIASSAPLSDFISAAQSHPVFEIVSSGNASV